MIEHITISKLVPKQADLDQLDRKINFWVSEGYLVDSQSIDTNTLFGARQAYVHLVRQ